jgi:hypothetical protein
MRCRRVELLIERYVKTRIKCSTVSVLSHLFDFADHNDRLNIGIFLYIVYNGISVFRDGLVVFALISGPFVMNLKPVKSAMAKKKKRNFVFLIKFIFI